MWSVIDWEINFEIQLGMRTYVFAGSGPRESRRGIFLSLILDIFKVHLIYEQFKCDENEHLKTVGNSDK